MNKRLVAMEDVEELLCTADEMLTGWPCRFVFFYVFLPWKGHNDLTHTHTHSLQTQ